MGSVGIPISTRRLPLTLQFNGCVAFESNPTNIVIIATSAVRRQPEYNFAQAHDQVARQRFDDGRSYPYRPAIFPLSRDDLPLEPKGGEVLPSIAIGTQDVTEVKNGSHVDPPHHMHELDKCHCHKMLLLLLQSGITRSQLSRGYGRAYGHRLARPLDRGSWS
jgi:hypothetical protein